MASHKNCITPQQNLKDRKRNFWTGGLTGLALGAVIAGSTFGYVMHNPQKYFGLRAVIKDLDGDKKPDIFVQYGFNIGPFSNKEAFIGYDSGRFEFLQIDSPRYNQVINQLNNNGAEILINPKNLKRA